MVPSASQEGKWHHVNFARWADRVRGGGRAVLVSGRGGLAAGPPAAKSPGVCPFTQAPNSRAGGWQFGLPARFRFRGRRRRRYRVGAVARLPGCKEADPVDNPENEP